MSILTLCMNTRDLSKHTAYEAGRGVEEVARELNLDPNDLIKLSSNENAFGASPRAVNAIQEYAPTIHTYPKSTAYDLRKRLAKKWDVTLSQIWLANGGDGALDYLARAFLEPNDSVLVSSPGFAYYGMSARFHHGTVNQYPIRKQDDFRQTAENVLDHYSGERIIYITSPHNPSGSEMPLEDVEIIATETSEQTLVVVDEAYQEFSNTKSARSLVIERDDVAVLRTFSKAYGLAGLRLGYAIVPAAWSDAYAKVNTPFAASEIACRAGLAAIDDTDHLEKTIQGVSSARTYLYDELHTQTWESAGNFVLAEVSDGTSVANKAQRAGVIVRDTTSFGLPECIRITCGTNKQMTNAVNVLNDII